MNDETRRPGIAWPTLVLNIALTIGCGFTGLAYATYAVSDTTRTGQLSTPATLGYLGCLILIAGLVAWLWWRARTPLALTLAASAAAIVAPIDAAVALVGAIALIHYRRGRHVWLGVAAALVAAGWAFTRDPLQPARHSIIASLFLDRATSRPDVRLDWNTPLATGVFVALMAGIVIGLGMVWRSRRELAASREEGDEARARNEALASDLARSTEREQIAREVHDALGHDLSLLSLQAASLELNDAVDPEIAESARAVRTTAQEAHKSLSSLVDMLRNPPTAGGHVGHVEAAPGLAQLSALLAESSEHGMVLEAVVLLADTASLDEATDRAVYRIVQETLTNARRHAPGTPVRLQLTGNQAEGLSLAVSNAMTGPPLPPGNGLTGMHERVALAGGTMTAGPTPEGRFEVRVWLPWHP